MQFDKELDARGLNCPLPILRTKKTLNVMTSGQVLKIVATDPGSVKDFEAFCALKPQWFPVKRMITGHVHPADGFALHASYKMNPALTLRGFGFEELRAMPGAYLHYVDTLHIAQGVPEQLPMVTEVPVSRGELAMMYSGLDLLPVSPSLSPVVPIAPAEPASVASSAKTSKER